jgi:hypothetical protein
LPQETDKRTQKPLRVVAVPSQIQTGHFALLPNHPVFSYSAPQTTFTVKKELINEEHNNKYVVIIFIAKEFNLMKALLIAYCINGHHIHLP